MDIFEALNEYEKNIDDIENLDALLHQEMDFDEWETFMKKRSELLSSLKKKNKDILSYIREYAENPLPDSDVEKLDIKFRVLYHKPNLDDAFLFPIADILYKHYKKKNEREEMLRYLYRLSYLANTICNLKCSNKIDYSYFYEMKKIAVPLETLNEMECHLMLSEYFNCILVYPATEYSIYKTGLDKYYDFYKECRNDFLPKIRENQKSDGFKEKEEILGYAPCYEFVNFTAFPKDVVEEFIPIVEEQYIKKSEEEKNIQDVKCLIAHYYVLLYEKKKDPDEILEEAYRLYMENPENSIDGCNEFECSAYNNSVIITDLAIFAKNKERRNEIIRNVGIKVMDSLEYYHNSGNVGFLYQYMYLWTMDILKYYEGSNKIEVILNNIIRSQPSTYIHSKMVKRIAILMLSYFYKERPELFEFLHMPFYELANYTGNAAILHDTGKIVIADVINTQARDLTDTEFEAIKKHPSLGLRILEKNPELLKYKDPVLYHHKWYNGEGGYPLGNDNVLSPYRTITDIITLADCLDAATDDIGRPYKHSKDAYQVLEEFKAGAGIKYNPDLVQILSSNSELMDELNRITKTERISMMYLQYKSSLELEKKNK